VERIQQQTKRVLNDLNEQNAICIWKSERICHKTDVAEYFNFEHSNNSIIAVCISKLAQKVQRSL